MAAPPRCMKQSFFFFNSSFSCTVTYTPTFVNPTSTIPFPPIVMTNFKPLIGYSLSFPLALLSTTCPLSTLLSVIQLLDLSFLCSAVSKPVPRSNSWNEMQISTPWSSVTCNLVREKGRRAIVMHLSLLFDRKHTFKGKTVSTAGS